MGRCVLRLLSVLTKRFDIFRRGLLPVAQRSISLGANDPGSLTLVQGHHEKSGIKVAFLLGKSVFVHVHNYGHRLIIRRRRMGI